MTEEREALLATATEAARQAGSAVIGLRRKPRVSRKGERDVVLEADLVAQNAATMVVRGHFPGDPILSEEDAVSGLLTGKNGRVWAVDPLDGTVNYLAGLPLWSVSVAAVVGGEAVAGAVYAPALEEMFTTAASARPC